MRDVPSNNPLQNHSSHQRVCAIHRSTTTPVIVMPRDEPGREKRRHSGRLRDLSLSKPKAIQRIDRGLVVIRCLNNATPSLRSRASTAQVSAPEYRVNHLLCGTTDSDGRPLSPGVSAQLTPRGGKLFHDITKRRMANEERERAVRSPPEAKKGLLSR